MHRQDKDFAEAIRPRFAEAIEKAEAEAGHPLRAIQDEKGRVAKQVIILRQKYPDENGELKKVRTGKLVAQGAHASLAAYKRGLRNYDWEIFNDDSFHGPPDLSEAAEAFDAWDRGAFTKIVLYVDTEEELVEIYTKAQDANLLSVLITDAGHTEFHGVPTKTAVAIGPVWDDQLKPITGHLKML